MENQLNIYMRMKNKTPYEVVQGLNNELYKKTKRDDIWFSYTLYNLTDSIAFHSFGHDNTVKIELWNSENSQQIYREKTNDYEPLEDTIKREFKLVVKELNKIKL